MPYAIKNPVDGEPRSEVTGVGKGYAAKPGEVVIPDEIWERTGTDWVWSEAKQAFRPPSADQVLTVEKKTQSEAIIRSAIEDWQLIMNVYEAVIKASPNTTDPDIQKLVDINEKKNAKLDQIESQTSTEAVRKISWNAPV